MKKINKKQLEELQKISSFITDLQTEIAKNTINNHKLAHAYSQQEIKLKYLTKSGIDSFIDIGNEAVAADQAAHFVDTLKDRIARVRSNYGEIKEFVKQEKKNSFKKTKYVKT